MHQFWDRVYSPALLKRGCTLIFILVSGLRLGLAQSTILISDPGTTYNNTDAVTTDVYGPVASATCGTIRYSIDFSFSDPWEGSGNMETADECIGGCAGNVSTPALDGCATCWDFLYVVFLADGIEVYSEVIGDVGTTDAEQSGTITFDYCASGMAGNVSMEVYTQTWAMAESVTLSNVTIECIDDFPAVQPVGPLCETDASVTLSNLQDGVFGSWSGPGVSGTTFDPDAPTTGPGTYTLTFTPNPGECANPVTIDVTVNSESSPVYQTATLCEGSTFFFGEEVLTSPGEYTSVFQDTSGCDSIVILNLISQPLIPESFDTSNLVLSSCQNQEGEGIFDLAILIQDLSAWT